MEDKVLKSIRRTKSHFSLRGKTYSFYRINALEEDGVGNVSRLPYSIKVLLEAAVREFDGSAITAEHIAMLANWGKKRETTREVPFKPSRILMHDTTGLPALVDLAAMRDTMAQMGGDVRKINPLIPVDLVVDHSVTIDYFGKPDAVNLNEQLNFNRNMERFRFLRWAQKAFANFRVVPPSSGIMHQVNMEFLSSVISLKKNGNETVIFPDSLIGTDSHTTMINGLGIVAWGVGGIEAEAAVLGQPVYFVMPEVVGLKLTGSLSEGVTATDLALTITNLLRQKGVVGKFVEFFGSGVQTLSVADRATIANMAPEYGATMGYFPVDRETINYLRLMGRDEEQIDLVETYYRIQGMYKQEESPEPCYSEIIELDLSTVVPCLAGPKRPQDRIELGQMKKRYQEMIQAPLPQGGYGLTEKDWQKSVVITHEDGTQSVLQNGAIVLAAITSCTNTSNPTLLVAAGLVARNAVKKGLRMPPYVKTSLSPGSRVVTDYLQRAGLLSYLEELGFYIAAYGCATCIGNSGPLLPEVSKAIADHELTVASVLSGNRNFEGRIHPQVKLNYLASPPLVVAYALAGTVNIDLTTEPIGYNKNHQPVYLKELWPSSAEIQQVLQQSLQPELFRKRYEVVYEANEQWNRIDISEGLLYQWDERSCYIRKPPFLERFRWDVKEMEDIKEARVLALLGDVVTTDHLSPSGVILLNSPAGLYLQSCGVEPKDFNSYPSRRGNHHVMVRGALANVLNLMVPEAGRGMTKNWLTGEIMSIYDAAMKYKEKDIPLLIIAGKEYGTGSSRDWAAKGTYLLGVKAVIAESFERIHRSNLVGMGVLPLQFVDGINASSLGITGAETFRTIGLDKGVKPGQKIKVEGIREDGTCFEFDVIVRLDNAIEVEYYRNGGIMQTVMRRLAQVHSEIR
ncbi:aconitate hydratase AcnA [Geobacillus zalihae]|uniref:aconitate hydratase AcnA n=1 Tax=Geobacillus zalihae TaxID=213419 RepID=UPI002620CCA1|nr:aconitate hydratase AcnA [Geobacillus zalihae]WKA48413.1 aconitate hydratase AcnA [Geobacillus zalihae]